MALSNRIFDKTVEKFLKDHPEENYLDIGTGAGKYGKMIKSLFPKAFVLGIEASLEYIQKYKVHKIYDELKNQRIEDFIKQNPSFTTDIAIMGDLLEHLFKSDGVNLIHYLMYRVKFLVILFPSKFVQYDLDSVVSEAHNSVWDESDFSQFDYTIQKNGHMNLVIIKGYLEDPEAIIHNKCK